MTLDMPPILQTVNPPAQNLGMAYLAAFPDGRIVSGRRSIDSQAVADAANTIQNRNYIAETYMTSRVKDAMVAICNANPAADRATLASLFAGCLGGFLDDDLSHFSLHLSGNALDLSPCGDPAREAWAEHWVQSWILSGGSARSKVITREAGEVRLHVQVL